MQTERRMDKEGNLNLSREHNSGSQRKNSDLIKEAHATFSVLPQKDSQDLREFLNENLENVRTYDLTEDNLKSLRRLRKFPSFSYIWVRRTEANLLGNEETNDLHKRETTSLFVSNIVLTTRLKKLIEENKDLKKTLSMLEVVLEE